MRHIQILDTHEFVDKIILREKLSSQDANECLAIYLLYFSKPYRELKLEEYIDFMLTSQ